LATDARRLAAAGFCLAGRRFYSNRRRAFVSFAPMEPTTTGGPFPIPVQGAGRSFTLPISNKWNVFMATGIVIRYLADRRFGFIRPDENIASTVFFHCERFTNRRIAEDEDPTGRRVTFEIRPDRKDPTRFAAYDLELLDG
jgi:cold shock CspA family protein